MLEARFRTAAFRLRARPSILHATAFERGLAIRICLRLPYEHPSGDPIRPPAIMAIERTEGFDAYVGRSERAQHEAMMAAADCRYVMLEDETGLPGLPSCKASARPMVLSISSASPFVRRVRAWQAVPRRADPAVLRGVWCGEVLAGCVRDQCTGAACLCGLRPAARRRVAEHYPLADGTRANLVVMSVLKREWVDAEARRQSRLVAEADARDAETAEFMDAALVDIARSESGKDV